MAGKGLVTVRVKYDRPNRCWCVLLNKRKCFYATVGGKARAVNHAWRIVVEKQLARYPTHLVIHTKDDKVEREERVRLVRTYT